MAAARLRLQSVGRPSVACRYGTSDIAVLWEIFANDDYFIPERATADVRTVLDLGANVGYSMIYFAHRYPNACVVGVEPDQQSAAEARHNLNSNSLNERCMVIEAAAWTHDTRVELDRNRPEYAYRVLAEASEPAKSVAAYSLPTLFRLGALERVDLLKLDVEGAERRILATMDQWSDRVSSIICELHDDFSFDEFRSITLRYGFHAFAPGSLHGLKHPYACRP